MGNTVEEYCRVITETCLSEASLVPLQVGPSATFTELDTRTSKLSSDIWSHFGCSGVHWPRIEKLKGEVKAVVRLLEDIECYGLEGMEELQRAYEENELSFQKVSGVL